MLQTVFGFQALIWSNVSEWFKRSKDERKDLQDDQRSRRPSTSRKADTMANVHEKMARDREWSLRMMSDELHINKARIRQSSMESYGSGNVRKARPTQTNRRVEGKETHIMPRLHRKTISVSLITFFSFLR
jgi:hypothetical protein